MFAAPCEPMGWGGGRREEEGGSEEGGERGVVTEKCKGADMRLLGYMYLWN